MKYISNYLIDLVAFLQNISNCPVGLFYLSHNSSDYLSDLFALLHDIFYCRVDLIASLYFRTFCLEEIIVISESINIV